MITLRLADGGRLAVEGSDVAIALPSPWGSIIQIASTGCSFEVEHSLKDLEEMMPALWLHGAGAIMNPELLASVEEKEDCLKYTFQGGLTLTQEGFFLDQLLEALEKAKCQRAELGQSR